jgi:hypothetical protein
MHANTTAKSTTTAQKTKSTQPSRRRAVTPLDSDADADMSDLSATHIDPLRPWLDEYQGNLAAREAVPEGMSTIAWWGVSTNSFCVSVHLHIQSH